MKNLRCHGVTTRPLYVGLLLLFFAVSVASAQVPSITTSSKLRFTEGNTIFDRTVGDIFSTIDVDLSTGITGVLPVANGGTNISSYAVGDIIYASGATTLSKLAGVATGNALISGGVTTAPSWGKIGLTTHVSGTLPVANGGTNLTTFAQGDIIYASASNTLSALAKNASATRYLSNTGTSNNPAWAQVDLTNGVTGTLPVGNGGTGAATYTNNRLLTGNGTSAIVDEANATFDGTTLTITGKQTWSVGGSYSTAQTFGALTGTVTSTANSLTHYGIRIAPTFTNDGTLTGQGYYAAEFAPTLSGSSSASNLAGFRANVASSSANLSAFYGNYSTITEGYDAGSLSNRVALRGEALFSGTGDYHTVHGVKSDVSASGSGRWLTGYGAQLNLTNAKNAQGLEVQVTNNRGTANTQRGIRVFTDVSGSGVVVDNAYGIELRSAASSSGVITNYYGLYQNTVPAGATNTYFLYGNQSGAHSYLSGGLSTGVNSTGAKLTVRGTGNTSGSTTALFENSSGTDIFTVRDDGMSSFGTSPNSTRRLVVRGASSDTTSVGFEVQRSSGTPTFAVRNDGKVTINNASPYELLTVPGKVRADGIVLTNQVASTSAGQIIYNTAGYYTLGDGTRATAYMPTMIEREVLGWAVNWTTGRKGAFWTVPSRFDGWKISKAYIEVTAIGSGAGDDELTIEIGGVGEGVQIITAGTHTLVMDDVINTDDVITFNITQISATPAQGLNVSLELAKQ